MQYSIRLFEGLVICYLWDGGGGGGGGGAHFKKSLEIFKLTPQFIIAF